MKRKVIDTQAIVKGKTLTVTMGVLPCVTPLSSPVLDLTGLKVEA